MNFLLCPWFLSLSFHHLPVYLTLAIYSTLWISKRNFGEYLFLVCHCYVTELSWHPSWSLLPNHIIYLQTWTSGYLLSSGNLSESRVSKSESEAVQQGTPHLLLPAPLWNPNSRQGQVWRASQGKDIQSLLIPASKKLIRALYKFWVPLSLPEPERVDLPPKTDGFSVGPSIQGGNWGNFSN